MSKLEVAVRTRQKGRCRLERFKDSDKISLHSVANAFT
jgi:hypothetical protein